MFHNIDAVLQIMENVVLYSIILGTIDFTPGE